MSRERSEVAASGLSSVMRRSLIIDGKTEEKEENPKKK
jgi:hypothetical protein